MPPTSRPESTTFIAGGTHVQGTNVILNYHDSHAADKLLANAATSALYNTAQIEDPARCHPGTREAILRRLRASLDPRSADKPFVWLHGAAGVGKSAIVRTLCEGLYAEKERVVSFFFFRTSPERNSSARFIATLALQFQSAIPQLRSHIKQCIDDNPHIFTQSVDAQAQQLVIDPIQELHDNGVLPAILSMVVAVDGLDECQTAAQRREVLDVLHKLKSSLPFPITTLVASRPNRDIEQVFKQPPFEDETTEEPLNLDRDVDADILKFYTDSFARIEKFHPRARYFLRVEGVWPAPDIIHILIQKTSGQFIFAKTVIRFVEPETSDPEERLQIIVGALPPLHYRPFQQLDAIYKLVLSLIEPDRIQIVLAVLGIFLCDYSSSYHAFLVLSPRYFSSLSAAEPDCSVVEWVLDLKAGQCQQLLIGLESLLTLTPTDNLQIFHKSFSDFLFDPLRSEQFHVAPDLVYERILRSFVKHNLYHPSHSARRFMFTNMDFLFANARITPELLLAIEHVDFVQSNAVVRSSEQALDRGEDSWLRICELFVHTIINSHVPGREQLAAPLLTSLKEVAISRLSPYLDNPTLWPLLYISTLDPDSQRNRRGGQYHLLKLIPLISPDLLHLERTSGYHFSMSDPGIRTEILYLLSKPEGLLYKIVSSVLPECQSLDGFTATLLLKLVNWCMEGVIDQSFLTSSGFLGNTLRFADPSEVLWTKVCAFRSAFEEHMDAKSITQFRRYGERCVQKQVQQELWDPDTADSPILHVLTDDWRGLETMMEPNESIIPPSFIPRQPQISPSMLYCIPVAMVVGIVLYRQRLLNR